jgi:hypothetical protein
MLKPTNNVRWLFTIKTANKKADMIRRKTGLQDFDILKAKNQLQNLIVKIYNQTEI